MSNVWAPGTVTEGESFLWYRAEPRLQLGIAYLWNQRAFRGLGNYTLLRETERTPGVHVGVGLQGIGTGNPGYFATTEKTFRSESGSLNGFVGVGFRANESHGHLLGGFKFTPEDGPWTLGVQADGHNVHPFITRRFDDMALGLYLVNSKTLGVMVSWSR
jgi:hypothetical protein